MISGSSRGSKNTPYIVAAIIIASVVILATTFKFDAPAAGDGKCAYSENCFDNPEDCNCDPGKYCSSTAKKCTSTVCGNGVCESLENAGNCCLDCGCNLEQEMCNRNTQRCELPDIGISDKIAEQVIEMYFNSRSQNVLEIRNMKLDVYESEIVKSAEVMIGGEDKVHLVVITARGHIEDVPIYSYG